MSNQQEPEGVGGGKYGYEATQARMSAKAAGVILIVFEGELGNGFSVQAPPDICINMPRILRELADSIEQLQKKYSNQ